jgi:hypothetical protein
MSTVSEPSHSAAAAIRAANRRAIAAIVVVLVLVTGTVIGGGIWIVHEVAVIRDAQQANTVRSDCQDRALNAVLKDARLALQGDRNAADYAVAPKC